MSKQHFGYLQIDLQTLVGIFPAGRAGTVHFHIAYNLDMFYPAIDCLSGEDNTFDKID